MSKNHSKQLVDLTIEKIEHQQQHDHPPVAHKVLPQHAFSMLIVAPKGSGKTNFLCNLIMKHYKGYFNRILVSSPTINNDEKWDVVKNTRGILKENKPLNKALNLFQSTGKIKKIVYSSEGSLKDQQDKKDGWDGKIPEEDFFADIESVPERIKEQQEILEALNTLGVGTKRRYLIDRQLLILDDQAGMFKSGSTNNPMANLVIKHRHTSTSLIIVTQAYKAIPKTIRTNCNALVLFEIPNLQELKVIYEEYPEGMNEDEWTNVYKHATKEAYSFLYMNNKFPKGERVYKNFDKLLSIHEEPEIKREGEELENKTKRAKTDEPSEKDVTKDNLLK